MTPATFPAALAARLRSDPARPFVTFYDDATGERVELSATTWANWVAKTASLAQDELDAERGGLVLVDLPTHWLGAVWLGAAWSLGMAVTDDPALAPEADLVVCGPAGLASYTGEAGRVPVLALSLRPLGGRFTEALPDGVTDYGAVVLAQPDAFTPYDPPDGGDVAWHGGGSGETSGSTTQRDLLAEAEAAGVVEPEGRLLTDVSPTTRVGALTLLGALLAGAGLVLVRNPADDGWAARADQERATHVLRSS